MTIPIYVQGVTLYNMVQLDDSASWIIDSGPIELPSFFLDPTEQVTHLGHPLRVCEPNEIYQQVYNTAKYELDKMHQKPMPTPLPSM